MEIKLGIDNFQFQPVINQSNLNSEIKEQLTDLFEKIVKKGYLGVGGSSRLDYLLRKLNQSELVLIPTDKPHVFNLKFKKADEVVSIKTVANVNQRIGSKAKTPLQLAISTYKDHTPEEREKSRAEIHKLLSNKEIDINLTDREGWSAAYQATQLSDPWVLSEIANMPGVCLNSKNIDKSTPLIRAADRNNLEAVRVLLQHRVNVNISNVVGTALFYAVRKGQKEIALLLLAAGADVNRVSAGLGKTPLALARANGYAEIAKALVEAGGQEVSTPSSELHRLVRNGGKELEDYLKKDVNAIDEHGRSAAHYWAYEPKEEIGKFLLEMGANFDRSDKFGRTPLHYASMQGNIETIKFLFEQKVDLNQGDKQGYTPLFWAAQHNLVAVASILIDNGANIDHTDKFDWTPLDKAAESKSPEICRLLCPKVDVNRVANDGRTALHKASVNGADECVAVLIEYGAHTEVYDLNGKRPVDYAPKNSSTYDLLSKTA